MCLTPIRLTAFRFPLSSPPLPFCPASPPLVPPGYEKHEELRVVAARVAVLGRKGADVRLRRLERVLAHLDSPDANYKDFAVSSAEGEVLLRFMREQAEATNTLKAEMEAIQLLHSR
ncbi:unnamed protein product [Closterium sp. NIES-54]